MSKRAAAIRGDRAERLSMIASAAAREWPDCVFLGEESFDSSGEKRLELDDVRLRCCDRADASSDRQSSSVHRPVLV